MKKRHVWIMLLCCLLPIIGLMAIFLLNIPANTVLYFALILLFPIAHFFMKDQTGHKHDGEQPNEHLHVEVEDNT